MTGAVKVFGLPLKKSRGKWVGKLPIRIGNHVGSVSVVINGGVYSATFNDQTGCVGATSTGEAAAVRALEAYLTRRLNLKRRRPR